MSVNLNVVRMKEIQGVINKMSSSRCEDKFNINSIIFKYDLNYISEALISIINACIINSEFPEDFKSVKVVPILKKNCPSLWTVTGQNQ